MSFHSRVFAVPVALTLAATLFAASASAEITVTRLGGRNAFHRTALETSAEATRVLGELAADIDTVLAKAGWQGHSADLHAAIAKGEWSEIEIPIGGKVSWMALRRKGEPDVISDIVLAGKKPVPAYQLQFISNEVLHTFVVPKACTNLALSAQEKLPAPIAKVSAMPSSDCLTRQVTIDASASSVSHGRTIDHVEVSVSGPNGLSEKLPNQKSFRWTKSWREPGTYRFTAVAVTPSGRRSQPATASVERTPCPPTCNLVVSNTDRYTNEPFSVDLSASTAQVTTVETANVAFVDAAGADAHSLELASPFQQETMLGEKGMYTVRANVVDELGQVSENMCETPIRIDSRWSILADGLVGIERRWREEFPRDHSAFIAGLKVGPAYRVSRNFEIAAAVGGELNTRDTDNSSLFADVEANWMGEKGMFGMGVGLWDFTHDETSTGSFLVHGGVNLPWVTNYNPVIWLTEGRFFFDHSDMIDNNYLFWTGLRFHF